MPSSRPTLGLALRFPAPPGPYRCLPQAHRAWRRKPAAAAPSFPGRPAGRARSEAKGRGGSCAACSGGRGLRSSSLARPPTL